MARMLRYRPRRLLPTIVGGCAAGVWVSWFGGGHRAVVSGIAAQAGMAPDSVMWAGGVAAGALGWALTYLACGPGGWFGGGRRRTGTRPLSYADLGPPPPRERPLPTDLDQPLSAYDPDALRPGVRRPG